MKKIWFSLLTVALIFSLVSNTVLASDNNHESENFDSLYDASSYTDPNDILEIGVVQDNGDIITEEDLVNVEGDNSNSPWYDENGNIVEETKDNEASEEPGFSIMRLWYMTSSYGYVGQSYGSWINGVSGSGPSNLTLSKGVSVSHTYSGTLTATKSAVSAAVGFSISKTWSTNASYSVNVPKGQRYMIQYRKVYKKYKVGQKAYINSTYTGQTKYVYPKKYSHLEYRWKRI
jgi:hypothetical protein